MKTRARSEITKDSLSAASRTGLSVKIGNCLRFYSCHWCDLWFEKFRRGRMHDRDHLQRRREGIRGRGKGDMTHSVARLGTAAHADFFISMAYQ